MSFEVNQIYAENCCETMARMPEGLVDLTATSPPYDDLRKYKGYDFDAEAVIDGLYRVTKPGGAVVWIVADRTIDGDETGTSFRQALYAKSAGFKLWDTMIWRKTNPMPTDTRIPRYTQSFEYMFVFSKESPTVCNKLEEPCKHDGLVVHTYPARRENGAKSMERVARPFNEVKLTRPRPNVWDVPSSDGGFSDYAIQHPAVFPESLARDHILTWSNEGDLVYDPFTGSGTTAKMAYLANRNYIGSEISEEYAELARQRIRTETAMPLFDEPKEA